MARNVINNEVPEAAVGIIRDEIRKVPNWRSLSLSQIWEQLPGDLTGVLDTHHRNGLWQLLAEMQSGEKTEGEK